MLMKGSDTRSMKVPPPRDAMLSIKRNKDNFQISSRRALGNGRRVMRKYDSDLSNSCWARAELEAELPRQGGYTDSYRTTKPRATGAVLLAAT
eukprot:6191603-Pleurochrysis_carterae.AAC.2